MKLAELTGISQSKISKLETGLLLPTIDDVSAICAATGFSDAEQRILDNVERIRTEVVSWRLAHRQGLAFKQHTTSTTEWDASSIEWFEMSVVPGLLQTGEYAREVIRLSNVTNQSDLNEAVAARIARQGVLYDHRHTFRFVLTEAAVLSRFCHPSIALMQLGRLALCSQFRNVDIGILPSEVEIPVIPQNSFTIYDTKLVTIETTTAGVNISDEMDVRTYRDVFALIASAALFGTEMRAALRQYSELLQNCAAKRHEPVSGQFHA